MQQTLKEEAKLLEELNNLKQLVTRLDQERNDLKLRVEKLEGECEELRKQRRKRFLPAADLERERDELRRQRSELAAQQDELSALKDNLERQQGELQVRTIAFAQERDKFLRNRETAQFPQIARSMATVSHESGAPRVTLKLANLRDAVDMKPGAFLLLNEAGDSSGFTGGLLGEVCHDGYAANPTSTHKVVYDPIADQLLLFVTRSAPSVAPERGEILRYDISANLWKSKSPSNRSDIGCVADSTAINSAAREIYVQSMLPSAPIRRMNLDSGVWSDMTKPETGAFNASETSAEYFPERDELLWLQNKRLDAWKRSQDKWIVASLRLNALEWRGAIARYNPAAKCVMLLGGATVQRTSTSTSRAVYKYDSKGLIKRLTDSPEQIEASINRVLLDVDPVSGDFILAQLSSSLRRTERIELWKYNIDVESWTRIDSSLTLPEELRTFPVGGSMAMASLPKYGVMMFIVGMGANSRTYVYKHA